MRSACPCGLSENLPPTCLQLCICCSLRFASLPFNLFSLSLLLWTLSLSPSSLQPLYFAPPISELWAALGFRWITLTMLDQYWYWSTGKMFIKSFWAAAVQRGRGGGATGGPGCHAIRLRQSMGEPDWLSARLPGQEEGWHSVYPFVNVAWYTTVLPGSCCWTFQTTRGEQLNLCAARQMPAPARFPFSSAKKLICINLQAVGNPSLMIRYHCMHPFSAGNKKSRPPQCCSGTCDTSSVPPFTTSPLFHKRMPAYVL